jgi:hypothetical protein
MARTTTSSWDVKCMLCGTEVGQIIGGSFKKHAGCPGKLPRVGKMARCCHCGGSLYLDPVDGNVSQLARMKAMREQTTAA